jgi:hypothetical protein
LFFNTAVIRNKKMERALTKRVDAYVKHLTAGVVEKAAELGLGENDPNMLTLLHLIAEHPAPPDTSAKSEKSRRKSVYSASVSTGDRCTAHRADGKQCTRRHKPDTEFCGTHLKGTPHGIHEAPPVSEERGVEVWAQDIRGIIFWIDAENHVYNPEDVERRESNPRVIAHWAKLDDGTYTIPDFF